ncbi:MAG: hypothetical protein IKB55_00725 [Clostridia bacterium]|nr:hypothetical protein [Clostridia bacterium]
MSFIEELYYGNINPGEGPKYDRESALALQKFCKNEEKLTKMLKGESLKLFNGLVNASDELVALSGKENFVYGFRFAVQLMCDCFSEKF